MMATANVSGYYPNEPIYKYQRSVYSMTACTSNQLTLQ